MTGITGRTGRTWCCHVEVGVGVDVDVDVDVEMEVEVERGGVMVVGDGGDGEVAWLAGVAVRQSGCARLANGGGGRKQSKQWLCRAQTTQINNASVGP
jgi:hypothetical protein